MRVVVLLNREAGVCARGEPDGLRSEILAAFESRAIACAVELIDGYGIAARAQAALQRAREGEVDAIVVGGGDGSISQVAAVLAGTGVPIGILPLGTLNHFAKDLGLPLALEAAVATIATHATRLVDVIDVNGTVFVNNSSIGVYAHMVVDRDRRRSLHGVSRWRAMFWAALRVLRRPPIRRLRIRAEGALREYRTPFVLVTNNVYDLAPTAARKRQRLDAGLLAVYVAKRESRASVVWLAIRTLFGRVDTARDLEAFTTTAVEIHSRTSRLLVACDGEATLMRPPLQYEVWPAGLTVLAPTGGTREAGSVLGSPL